MAPGGEFYGRLLEVLHKVAAGWPKPTGFELRSMFVMASTAEAVPDVQAAVDGLVDPQFAGAVAALAWPCPPEPYLFKQLFVLRGGKD